MLFLKIHFPCIFPIVLGLKTKGKRESTREVILNNRTIKYDLIIS